MSLNFNYYTPTKIIFGKDSELQIGKILKEQKCHKILIHYGGKSIIKSGILDKIKSILTEEKINFITLGGVVPNPRLSLVNKGIELCKKENVDFILAIGGGSVIDSSKAIAYGTSNPGDVWDYYNRKRVPEKCLPIGVILTIAAAGSEMSNSSVITNDNGMIKRGYSNDLSRPKFAIMNPELTKTLSSYQTSCGITDILMHTMERYFTSSTPLEVTDALAESLIKTVMKNGLILQKDPTNYNARAEIMWAGSLSHNGLMGCGSDGGDWSTHKLEHELSGKYDVTHGAGLAAIWGHWARYVYKDNITRFNKFAQNIFNIDDKTKEDIALQGIEAMENYFRQINMPTSLKELGLNPTEKDLQEMAHKCALAVNGQCGSIKKLTEKEMLEIYIKAL